MFRAVLLYPVLYNDYITCLTEEEAVEFTAPLEDKKIQEGEDVTLECTVSQPDLTAEWKKDGSPVEASERIKPKSVDTTHSLHIENVTAEDSGEYEVQVGDTTSKSSIEVEGKFALKQSFFQ